MRTIPDFAQAWLAQRRASEAALERVHSRELYDLSDDEALARSEALLSLAAAHRSESRDRATSGFVRQQALFARAARAARAPRDPR